MTTHETGTKQKYQTDFIDFFFFTNGLKNLEKCSNEMGLIFKLHQ